VADREPDSDPDNWFDEPDVSDAWEARSERLARSRSSGPAEPDTDSDDWLSPAAAESTPRRTRSAPNRRQVALAGAAVLALALLLGILAAAGVFSSGSKPASLATTTAPTTGTLKVTTTTPTTPKPQVTVPTTGLKPGAKGAAVKQLQRALKSAGYSPGTIDGSYGPSTESAVKQFQQAHGLTADGIAGSKTLAALRSALP
jgi:Putative peptidoglycan binding domain